jgi:hypothetical protein
MGLKGYRLWVMGQLYSKVQSPAAGSGALGATTEDGVATFFLLSRWRCIMLVRHTSYVSPASIARCDASP